MTLAYALGLVVFVASAAVLLASIWWWFDAQLDYRVSQCSELRSVRSIGVGVSRLSWLRLLDGVAWFGVGLLVLRFNSLPNSRVAGRVLLLILMVLEIAKLLQDRWSRTQVDVLVLEELGEKKQTEIQALTAAVQELTHILKFQMEKVTNAS